jgi:hypothetical protein
MGTSIQDINLTLEEREALQLRAAGATFEEIGDRQGVTKSAAKKRVDRALDRTLREPAEQLRELEAVRLDRYMLLAEQAAHSALSHGKSPLFALDRLISLSERRSKLLGLDAPSRQVVQVIDDTTIDAEIQRLVAQLAENDPAAEEAADHHSEPNQARDVP